MKMPYRFLSFQKNVKEKYTFEQLPDDVIDFDSEALITKTLDPELQLLLGKASLVITANGSTLSHITLVANDYGIPIMLVEDLDLNTLPNKGTCYITDDTIQFLE